MSLEARVTELEVKLAFQDDLLDTLNHTVTRQQREIDMLQQQLRLLYQQLRSQGAGHEPGASPHEIPPHY
ncbi:MAG: SlyX family protein [Paludibacterium sp.]|uniref:SlyX family protein n=1 Tax=Paludibacterium sp. TaxID=1917523 RepID=UPI0025FFF900|nr:SlyX family protein [Paludibacterium sp.]MBV8048064.1 SlyX family protein [Paludibacterium sp.]MBV8646947.1 SlyX family protein [Paludibacterium sp.]